MNKHVIVFSAVIFELVGSCAPMLFGDNNLLGGWSILSGLIGGLVGVWIGVLISKRFF